MVGVWRASKSRFLTKSRVAFVAFAVIYASFLLVNLGYNSIRWDELVHCMGAWQLIHGRFLEYLTSSTFYPPMFNLVTAAFFGAGGANVVSARLVAVTFTVLSLAVLFEFVNRMYGSRVALLSVVFFAVMPGIVWASRFAYIETMLEFFFLLSLFFFFIWLQKGNYKYLFAGGLTLGLGFLVKYQMLVAGLVMFVALLVFGWNYLKSKLSRFSFLILIAAAVVVAWFVVIYVYAPSTLGDWIYAISVGDQKRSLYSMRFPTPVFYLIEMAQPYPDMHPISLLLYLLGFAGLGLMAWQRRQQDKFLVVWFVVVYAVFTLVGNREWRYVMPLFPVLAISASSAVSSAYDKAKASWQGSAAKPKRRTLAKVAAVVLIVFTASAVVVSCGDSYHWIVWDQVRIPLQEAVSYVAARIQPNESIALVCTFELFSGGMASFYLQTSDKQNRVLQYPALPVDTFTPTFSVDELVSLCQQNNARYVLLSEHHWTATYFNSTLTPQDVAAMMYSSGRFTSLATLGTAPDRIFILTFA